jgi:UDP-perosamine 4-acetyltransferase
MILPIIVIGAGGHAKVLISVLKALNRSILCITDSVPEKIDHKIGCISVLGNDEKILDYSADSVALVNGIGSVSSNEKRKAIFVKFKNYGYSFANVIHPSAIIMNEVQLGEGVQIMAGVIVQPGCVIGDNCIINTGATLDHDCIIGEHVHVAPGAILSGGVHVGAMTHIGTSATIIQGVEIGLSAVVGAETVVIADIPSGVKAVGVPARII